MCSAVYLCCVTIAITVMCFNHSVSQSLERMLADDASGSAESFLDISDNKDNVQGRSRRTLPLLPAPSISLPHSPARLRHSRHLLGRGAGGNLPHLPTPEALQGNPYQDILGTSFYSAGARGEGQVAQDNHKPVFTNCSIYHPSVKEEEPTGTFVFRVTATDRDPPDTGGSISYAFVAQPNSRPKFSIDNRTGEIRTRHMFDRDEPSREKEVYLTVRATDNGNPQLDDICTIKVTIEDINDNQPVFDKVNYQESVSKDLKKGNEVMRISATDIDDGNNSRVVYELEAKVPSDQQYFRVDRKTGVIYLDKEIDRDPGYHFRMKATAKDQGEASTPTDIDLEILVVESHKKSPAFVSIPASPIYLPENMNNFTYNIATFTAQSNTDEKAPVFVLVVGRTDQTNKQGMFLLVAEGTTAHVRLARQLDYETVSEYLLTIRIQNKYSLAAETTIKIQLEDVNDNIPMFTEGLSGHVLENEDIGTAVMQVQAIDQDSTSANNQITYELGDNQENFAIDPNTGNITTLKKFDREEKDFYNVKVIAWDNSPSTLLNTGVHNHGEQVFRIEIADKNDHKPAFTQKRYVAEAIPEDANNNALVTEVKAIDNDTASMLTYSIVEGNIDDAFLIESQTGKIRVNNHLDYENITSYTLKVRAFDGVYEDYAHVDIKIENVNDNPPVFYPYKNNITIQEETMEPGCIVELRAYDPDIPDRNEPQHIVYSVVPKQDQEKYLTISNDGCLSLLKPLDRDPPKGYPTWQVIIQATDQDGTPQDALLTTTTVNIKLDDINDNAPVLDMPRPVAWKENRPPGNIVKLEAKDNDGPDNGPPFKFQIASSASAEIHSKFGVSGDNKLTALVTFDREEKKSYNVQIAISDSGIPPLTGTSTLLVTIEDGNDNLMKAGSSDIFVYNYKGEAPDFEIGRVYVEDLDDWDLPDKSFRWANKSHPQFDLSDSTGMITMLKDTPEGSYLLEFLVTEESLLIPRHTVEAVVNVTIKVIPEEAVDKSGSIRLYGTSAEEFITPDSHGRSKKALLQARLAHMLNTSLDNVDVFTVLHSIINENQTLLDVRFSAHGSPYYAPERINQVITNNWVEMEKSLGVKILMVNIDECLQENGKYCKDSSCSNFLKKSTVPMAVYTNTTSFVGVNAIVNPLCTCDAKEKIVCHNGGTPVNDKCECVPGFEGPNCEILAIGFRGDGWALYPSFPPCDDSHLTLDLVAHKPDGLVFYIGPTNPHSYELLGVRDFMSLELRQGYPVLLVDFGTGTVKIEHKHLKVSDGGKHRIGIIWSKTSIELQVDNCRLPNCLSLKAPIGPHQFLNVNGPLQVGGTHVKLDSVADGMNWTFRPQDIGFSGCISNFTFNTKLYNLGMPSVAKNADPSCSLNNMAEAISFGINSSFIIAVLICLASLLILLLAVVVHRKKTDDMYKDTDDIRENIINYEDEGGGEGDMTGYDLNVLRLMYDDPLNEKQMPNNTHLIQRPDDVPDICGFLDGKKQSVDNDPETNPFDDVRHYAYEGDGNTTGSLSSLASGTDEGDLNFDYLSNFGPRFRKLADMYGEDPSDEEDDNFHNAASESWC